MAISYIGGATGTTTATMPAHQTGDLILVFGFRDLNPTPPTPVAGYTTINSAGLSGAASILAYKIATSDTETLGTWSTVTYMAVHVYRGVDPTNPIGGNGAGTSAGFTITYPAVTMANADGSSWIAAFSGYRRADTTLETVPAGMVLRTNVGGSPNNEVAGFDTNGGVTSFAATNTTITGTTTARWRANTVELRAAPGAGATVKVWDGSIWKASTVKRWNGTAWVAVDLKVFDGSTWI